MIHLLQSTMFIGIAWLLTLALRNHRAAIRYRIWLAAAVKFLIPLSLLVRAGGHLGWQVSTRASTAVEALSGPLGLSRAVPPAACATLIDSRSRNYSRRVALRLRRCGDVVGASLACACAKRYARADPVDDRRSDSGNVGCGAF